MQWSSSRFFDEGLLTLVPAQVVREWDIMIPRKHGSQFNFEPWGDVEMVARMLSLREHEGVDAVGSGLHAMYVSRKRGGEGEGCGSGQGGQGGGEVAVVVGVP